MSRHGRAQSPEQLALDLTGDPAAEAGPTKSPAQSTTTPPPSPRPALEPTRSAAARASGREKDEAPVELEDLTAGQLALGGIPGQPRHRGRAGMLPSQVWQQLLDHAPTRERYMAKVHRRGADACWYWCGAISSTGHGKLKTRATGEPIVVTAHVYGYQLEHGVIRMRPGQDLVIGHRCDESSCQNPAHWELIERAVNDADYRIRRHRVGGPLADVRGAHGRAVAIREAIRAALGAGVDPEPAIAEAIAAGIAEVDGLF